MSRDERMPRNPHCSTADPTVHVWTATVAQRLDEFLLSALPDASRNGLRRLLAAGACRVEGEPRTAGYRLASGQMVEFTSAYDPQPLLPEAIPLDILYEDDLLIAVDKPAGMLVHPTSRERSGTLANALRHRFTQEGYPARRPHFLHRLDRATSGVLLAAKYLPPRSPMARLFQSRSVRKSYLAVVDGEPEWETVVARYPISRDPDRRPQWDTGPEGANAETRLQVLARCNGLAVVQAEPVTGRTNQIRIHCAALGHPILGDIAYRGRPADRLFLHAWKLDIADPVLALKSLIPKEFIALPEWPKTLPAAPGTTTFP